MNAVIVEIPNQKQNFYIVEIDTPLGTIRTVVDTGTYGGFAIGQRVQVQINYQITEVGKKP